MKIVMFDNFGKDLVPLTQGEARSKEQFHRVESNLSRFWRCTLQLLLLFRVIFMIYILTISVS